MSDSKMETSDSANPMDKLGGGGGDKKDTDSLGEMINSAAMSILDGEDFTMGPVPVKWVICDLFVGITQEDKR